MRRHVNSLVFVVLVLGAAPPWAGPGAPSARLDAQEGHPLTGTWAGEWGPAGSDRTRVTVVLNWDGKNVTGVINPGPDSVPVGRVSVDWPTWTVRLQADGKDASGRPVRIEADGRLEDIGSYHRRLVGTWTQGGVTGDLRLTRD